MGAKQIASLIVATEGTRCANCLVGEFISLDGVAQAPGDADEDRDGGFRHGGWHLSYMDEMAQEWVLDMINGAGGLVLGRRT